MFNLVGDFQVVGCAAELCGQGLDRLFDGTALAA